MSFWRIRSGDAGPKKNVQIWDPQRLASLHVISKVGECSSALEVCKSFDVLQAMRWTAMSWNDVSESAIVKCFIKAGILNREGETNAAQVTESTDVDPFADLDEEFNIVNDLVKETSSTNAAPIRDKVVVNFDPPVAGNCQIIGRIPFFAKWARFSQMSKLMMTLLMSAIMMMTAFKGLLRSRNWHLTDRRWLVWRTFSVS